MAKAIIWCRVSTDQQEFESQKNDLIKTATNEPYRFKNSDLIIIGKSGASAIKMNEKYRQEVNELIETIKNTPDITHIFVWEVSRLARNFNAFNYMVEEIIKYKKQFICNVPQIKLLDDNGMVDQQAELMLHILVTLAKQEMEIKKKRFAKGKRQKAKEGKYSGGKIPFGYRVYPDKDNFIDTDEREADIVRKIYNMYENGYSQSKIAIKLKEDGYTNPRYEEPRQIQLGQIAHILKNKCYTGKIIEEKEYRRKNKETNEEELSYTRYERKYPQIISIEQYNKCREIAKSNRSITGKGKNIYYATKLVKCLTCGCFWSASSSKVNYHCYNSMIQPKKWVVDGRKTEQCKNRTSLNINILDSVLWHFAKREEAFSVMKASKEHIEELNKKIAEYEFNIKKIPSQIRAIDKTIEKYAIRNAEGDLSDKIYKIKRNDKINDKHTLIDRKISLQHRIEELKNEIEFTNATLKKFGVNAERVRLVDALDHANEYKKQYNLIYNSLCSINDDKERYDIIHRHVGVVHVQNIKIKYKYKIGWRDTIAKRITIEYEPNIDINGNEVYSMATIYNYIPFNGKGNGLFISSVYHGPFDDHITDEKEDYLMENVLYEWEKDYMETSEVQFEDDDAPRRVSMIKVEYLNRFIDKGKKERKEREKEITYSSVKNYLRIEDVMNQTNLRYNQIYSAIKTGKLKAKIVKHKCFISPIEVEKFKNKVNENKAYQGDRLPAFAIAKKYNLDYNYVLKKVRNGLLKSEFINGEYLISPKDAEEILSKINAKGVTF